MSSNYSRVGNAKHLRAKFGKWLKANREAQERTQLDLSTALGHQYYTTVSQFERGISRVPPEDWLKYAKFLNIDPKLFARRALAHYDPHVYDVLFGDTDEGPSGDL